MPGFTNIDLERARNSELGSGRGLRISEDEQYLGNRGVSSSRSVSSSQAGYGVSEGKDIIDCKIN